MNLFPLKQYQNDYVWVLNEQYLLNLRFFLEMPQFGEIILLYLYIIDFQEFFSKFDKIHWLIAIIEGR